MSERESERERGRDVREREKESKRETERDRERKSESKIFPIIIFPTVKNFLPSKCFSPFQIFIDKLYNIMLQNKELCRNTIYSSSEASGVNHIIHRSQRLR